MKCFLTQEQIIGAVLLVVLVAGVKAFVALVPQHVLSPIVVADLLMVEQLMWQDTILLYEFDPNKADSLTLRQLGLKPWQIRNMMHYRAKNGRFRTPEDFSRLYGLTDSAYRTLYPYIAIDTMPFWKEKMERQLRDSVRRDSIRAHYKMLRDSAYRADSVWRDSLMGNHVRHAKKDTILELNTADTVSLQLIRGIGGATAVRIVKYRSQLGGFASVSQLHDPEMHLPYTLEDSILLHFIVETDSVHLIQVNHASIETLQRHPYINYEQADAIYSLRRRRFRLRSVHDLEQLECLSAHDITRLTPYLDFSN